MTLRIRTGIDLVDVARVERMMESGGEAWSAAIYTSDELLYCAGRPDRLASRWAAKEALLKAFGWRIGDVDVADVEVRSLEGEPPQLVLTRSALERSAGITLLSLALSMTHESGLAVAQVTALVEE